MMCWGVSDQLRIHNYNPSYGKWYGLFVCSATFFTYNFQRLIKFYQLKSMSNEHMIWISKHLKQLYILIPMSCLICGFSFFKIFHHNLIIFCLLIFSLIISFLYVVKIRNISLREVPYLKIHLIALVCTISVGLIILMNENHMDRSNFSLTNCAFVLAHYFYFLAITIPFDIRDLKYDSPTLKTIPQVVGIRKTRMLSLFLFVLYLTILVLFKTTIYKNPAFIITSLLTLILLVKSNEKRPDFYFSGVVEGSIFMMGLSYLVV